MSDYGSTRCLAIFRHVLYAVSINHDKIICYLILEHLLVKLLEPAGNFLGSCLSADIVECSRKTIHQKAVQELVICLIGLLFSRNRVEYLR